MKITKNTLKQLIKEELEDIMIGDSDEMDDPEAKKRLGAKCDVGAIERLQLDFHKAMFIDYGAPFNEEDLMKKAMKAGRKELDYSLISDGRTEKRALKIIEEHLAKIRAAIKPLL